VILARADSLQQLQSIMAEDPFHVHGVASYQLLEFTPTMAAPALESFIAS
jgi:uncharacterized protein YciI